MLFSCSTTEETQHFHHLLGRLVVIYINIFIILLDLIFKFYLLILVIKGMAWNDPPSFNYQQLSSHSGRKFKHQYVSDTKIGQPLVQQYRPPQHLAPQMMDLNLTQQPQQNHHQPQLQQQQQFNHFNFEAQPQPYDQNSTTNNYVSNSDFIGNPSGQDKLMFPLPPQTQPTFPSQPPQQ